MRRCGKCGVFKSPSEFHRRGTSVQAWCKFCRREYDAAYHSRNRARRISQARERHERLIAWHRQLKQETPCNDCGGFFHPDAMAWDHLPGTVKRADVSTLVRKNSPRLAIAEIAKCELVCANCHAIRSYERRRGV